MIFNNVNQGSGVTIGPADLALQGAPLEGGRKIARKFAGNFSENLTVVLAKVHVLG